MKSLAFILSPILSLSLALPQAPAPAQMQKVVVTVLDSKGSLIRGIPESGFILEEDGAPQKITSFVQDSDTPVSLGILIDKSTSMRLPLNTEGQQRVPAALVVASGVAKVLLRLMRPRDEFMLMTFDEDLHVKVNFTEDRKKIETELGAMRQVGGSTFLYESVVDALEKMKKSKNRRRGLIVITDAYDTSGKSLDELRSRISSQEVAIFTVGVRAVVDGAKDREHMDPLFELVLTSFAADSGGHSKLVEASELLTDETIQRIVDFIQTVAIELRGQYTLGYESSSALPAANRAIRVRTTYPDLRVRVRRDEPIPVPVKK